MSQFQSTRPHGARQNRYVLVRGRRNVSIHAPARGATAMGLARFLIGSVSIHAPARGATASQPRRRREWFCFNPRARTGRDITHISRLFIFCSFNPRARTGRDTTTTRALATARCFNPRARTGRDVVDIRLGGIPCCFNPRARTGRDDCASFLDKSDGVSIHAPARGATTGQRCQ